MKTFIQTKTDFATITTDSAFDSTQFLNMAIQSTLGKFDWNFNKDSCQYTSVAQQQYYPMPYNMRSASYVNVFANSIYYVPEEIRQGSLWRKINYVTTVYSDVPYYWFVSNRTKQIGLFPTPANAGNPIVVGYTKATKVYGVANYTTGTVSTVANSVTVTGAGGAAFDDSMIGSFIKITSTDTVLAGLWFEIADVPTAVTLTLRNSVPVAVAGKAFIIAELIPYLDGYEDLALYQALETYYHLRQLDSQAEFYKEKCKEMFEDMKQRDMRSESDLIKKQTGFARIDPNRDPYAIFVKNP